MRVPSFALRIRSRKLSEGQRLACLALCLFVIHLWLIAPVLQNGDGAVYNEQIEHQQLNMRTPHVGYMVLGIVFNRLLPFGTDRDLNLMCLAFASAGAAAAGSIARQYSRSWITAIFSALLVFGVRPFLRGAVLSEVDGVSCSLILISVAAWVNGRRILAGAIFGAAMLVTPLAGLSLPLLLLSRSQSKDIGYPFLRHLRNILVLGLTSLVVYGPFVLYFWQDYWYGGRGLLRAPRQPWDLNEHIMRSVRFFTSTAQFWLAIGIAGLVVGLYKRWGIAVGILVATVGAAVIGERFLDVPVQLPQLCLLAIVGVLLLDQILDRKVVACALITLWAVAAFPAYVEQREEVHVKVQLAETYQEMARQTPKLMVIGLGDSWIDGLQFERLIYHRTKLGLGLDYRQFGGSSFNIARTHRDYAVWLMTPPPQGTMSPFLSAWRREYRSVVGRRYEVWLPSGT